MNAASFAWQSYALCAQMDPDLWHLSPQMGGKYSEAKRWCRRCPVVAQCGRQAIRNEWGLPSSERRGVFGAMTPRERVSAEQRVRSEVVV